MMDFALYRIVKEHFSLLRRDMGDVLEALEDKSRVLIALLPLLGLN